MTRHVPNDWRLEKLGQLFEERKEKVSDKEYLPLSVTKQGIVPQMEHVAKSDDSDNRKRVAAGDFVINSRSDRRGSSGLSELDGSVSLINMALKPRHGHARFIHHLMRSYAFQEEFYRFGHGIVADLWTTRYSELKGITVALPDEETQKEIADFLDRETARIDQLIEKKKRLIEMLEIRFSSYVNEVMSGYEARKLKTLASAQLSNVDKHIYDDESEVNVVHYTDAYYNDLITKETPLPIGSVTSLEKQKFILKGGEVIVTKDSETPDDIAIPVYIESVKENTVCGYHLAIIRPKPNLLDGKFLFWSLKTKKVRDYFSLAAQGVTRFGIPIGKISDCPMPYTSNTEEQARLGTDLFTKNFRKNELVKNIQSSIERLKEFRTSLITEAVTGQLDIKTWKKKRGTDKCLDNIEEAMAS
jgi:type I restriction enzyme S subunit